MTVSDTATAQLLETFRAGGGAELIREAVELVLQELIEAEATEAIGAGRYERTRSRTTARNGHRGRLLATQAGDLELKIPKLRNGRPTVGFKLEKTHAEAIVADPRFTPSKYVGRHGWVTMDLTDIEDWGHVEDLILESFHLIAPKRTLAKLNSSGS